MPVRTLRSAADVVDACQGDPFARYELAPDTRVAGFARDDAVVWATRSAHHGVRWMTGLGPAEGLASLTAEAVDWFDEPPYGITVGRHTLPLLPDTVAPASAERWDWWWCAEPPPLQPYEDEARWETDEAEVAEFLVTASPRRSADPGDERVQRWASIRRDGRIVATAAETQHVPGVPHLASIAVAPDARGEGLGGAVTAWITRTLMIDGASVVTLGMYADNEPARRVYRRLGYRDEHHFASGRSPFGDVRAAVTLHQA